MKPAVQVTPPTSPIATGTVIAGRYRLGQLLGSGGMAFVYDGVDLRLQRLVAVKLLRPEMLVRDDIRTRFESEARNAAGFSHPNAVQVYDTGEHDGVPFLIMERLPGETLADRIAVASVDPDWLREAAQGVLGALAAAHAAGVVHRDVKPGNILLAADGTAKISDFGIAKSVPGERGGGPDLTAADQIWGTPAYLAPERLEGKPATVRSDLFGLGVVLYEALTGQKPFVGETPLEVARAISEGNHVPLARLRPDVDPTFIATIERALARDPDHRFNTADEMAAALTGAAAISPPGDSDATVDEVAGDTMVLPVAGGGPEALPEAAPAPPPTGGRRPWLPWLVGAALLILLVLLLANRSGDPAVQTGDPRAATTVAQAPSESATPPSTTPVQALAQRLRELAATLDPAKDGPKAGDLANALRHVAHQLEAGGGGPEATGLLVTVAQWLQSGQLSTGAAVTTVELLRQVPGIAAVTAGPGAVSSSSASSPSTPSVSASATARAESGYDDDGGQDGRGGGDGGNRGKGNKKDD